MREIDISELNNTRVLLYASVTAINAALFYVFQMPVRSADCNILWQNTPARTLRKRCTLGQPLVPLQLRQPQPFPRHAETRAQPGVIR